ncbi:nuclear transport factor 2 family protein [Micromonospora sp. RTP1Z1]|uniref:nuclear transport factor 2 family protein n=1 Tax=Micromonospora sp. RTP1Z1 TaxID=2994043 RepID=UPI0029C995C4|nr:nuclear transport factor 2 family protein [Micromonospora sp. RTP1Z1]
MDEQAVRAVLTHYIAHSGTDEDTAHEIYHPDAVLEFPQSGERFDGVENFREWRRRYPAAVSYELGRVRGGGDVWVAELLVWYDGGPPKYGVDILEFRGDRLARESIYVTDGWEAPAWRAPWRAAPATHPTGS